MYYVKKNKNTKHDIKSGIIIETEPFSKYTVNFKQGKSDKIVFHIPDYYQNSEGIAEGVCKLLNSGKIILPLDI